MKFPLDLEKKFIDDLNEVPTETRSKSNAALCEDVIDAIQNAQEVRLYPETAKLTEFGASFRTKTEPSKVSVSCQTAYNIKYTRCRYLLKSTLLISFQINIHILISLYVRDKSEDYYCHECYYYRVMFQISLFQID